MIVQLGPEQNLKLGTDLERLVVNNEDFVALEGRLGRFCLFEALNIIKGEVPLGNLLAVMLDPNQPHGFGSSLLRVFLMEVIRVGHSVGADTGGLAPLSAHLLDFGGAEVRREWRQIDILIVIESAQLVIAVELKFGSPQSPTQLRNYRDTVEKAFPDPRWRRLYVFLTVNPEEPRDPVWIPLRYETLVPAFGRIDLDEADPSAAIIFDSFLNMLRRHHVTDEEMEEIARKLWAKHKAALIFLADRRPDGMRGVFAGLGEQIPAKFSDPDFTFEIDKGGASVFRFGCHQWDSLPDVKGGSNWTPSGRFLLFELKREGEQANGFLYLGPPGSGPDSQPSRARLLKALAPHRHRQDLPPGSEWTCMAKKPLFIAKANEDLDVGVAKQAIAEGFVAFCCQIAKKIDPVLKAALVPSAAAAD